MSIRAAVLAIVLTVCFATIARAEDLTIYVASGGTRRDAVVHTPPNYNPNSAYPLMLVMHPANGTGAGTERTSEFDAVADQYGFFVVYPDSIGDEWDETTDPLFINALINRLGNTFPLDPRRVYISGYSDGAGFTDLLICTETFKFAGAGTVSIAMQDKRIDTCHITQPITYVTFHGTLDPIIPYNGGMTHGPDGPSHETNSTLDTVQFFAKENNCSPVQQIGTFPDHLNNGLAVTDLLYQANNCANSTNVTLYTITGGGHTWPGGTQANTERLGAVSEDVDASQIIWQILSSHQSSADNVCFGGNIANCAVPNGIGSHVCNASEQWGKCVATSCNPGFRLNNNGTCVAKARRSMQGFNTLYQLENLASAGPQ